MPSTPIFDPEELIGKTFLMDEDKDGNRLRARIVKLVEDHETSVQHNPTRLKFICSVNGRDAEEIITYTKMLDYLGQDDNPTVWKYRRIVSHQGPLTRRDKDYNGSTWNVQVEWENGEITTEPMTVIAADDPVTVAIYAKENGLLDQPGWKRFKSIAKRQKKFERMANQAKMRSFNLSPRYKYGFEVPRTYDQAIKLDQRNNNTKWQEAVKIELAQID